jgi:hypothetical protein
MSLNTVLAAAGEGAGVHASRQIITQALYCRAMPGSGRRPSTLGSTSTHQHPTAKPAPASTQLQPPAPKCYHQHPPWLPGEVKALHTCSALLEPPAATSRPSSWRLPAPSAQRSISAATHSSGSSAPAGGLLPWSTARKERRRLLKAVLEGFNRTALLQKFALVATAMAHLAGCSASRCPAPGQHGGWRW